MSMPARTAADAAAASAETTLQHERTIREMKQVIYRCAAALSVYTTLDNVHARRHDAVEDTLFRRIIDAAQALDAAYGASRVPPFPDSPDASAEVYWTELARMRAVHTGPLRALLGDTRASSMVAYLLDALEDAPQRPAKRVRNTQTLNNLEAEIVPLSIRGNEILAQQQQQIVPECTKRAGDAEYWSTLYRLRETHTAPLKALVSTIDPAQQQQVAWVMDALEVLKDNPAVISKYVRTTQFLKAFESKIAPYSLRGRLILNQRQLAAQRQLAQQESQAQAQPQPRPWPQSQSQSQPEPEPAPVAAPEPELQPRLPPQEPPPPPPPPSPPCTWRTVDLTGGRNAVDLTGELDAQLPDIGESSPPRAQQPAGGDASYWENLFRMRETHAEPLRVLLRTARDELPQKPRLAAWVVRAIEVLEDIPTTVPPPAPRTTRALENLEMQIILVLSRGRSNPETMLQQQQQPDADANSGSGTDSGWAADFAAAADDDDDDDEARLPSPARAAPVNPPWMGAVMMPQFAAVVKVPCLVHPVYNTVAAVAVQHPTTGVYSRERFQMVQPVPPHLTAGTVYHFSISDGVATTGSDPDGTKFIYQDAAS